MHFRANIIVSLFACTILSSSVLASPVPIEPILQPIIAAKNNMGGTDTLGYDGQGQINTTAAAAAIEANGTVSSKNHQLLLVVPAVLVGVGSIFL
ncbi:hypothetical protein D9758_013374 [Tetrapyrgos nigripes]|uniref:Uncharacterized protein n=1 Tax=Tetrapyrgos nigripes TaxID=182062 RepID=A0A8H5CK71_9AGAR|nr:hypothetical protein D9758_013374 [Tetrapyrgos nigripes]